MARAKRHYIPFSRYKSLFDAENDDIDTENSYFWEVSTE
jgi:hypothetical protein